MRRAAIAAVRRDPEASAFDYMQHIINQAYIDALVSSGMMPVIIPVLSPDMAHDALLGCDGLLLPGGGDVDPSLYGEEDRHCGRTDRDMDEFHIALVREADRMGIPILGICRGIQVINTAFGGKLYQDIALEKGSPVIHRRLDDTSGDIHAVSIKEDTLLHGAYGRDRIMVNSVHHQAVRTAAEGFSVSAVSEDGVIEAIEGRNAIGVQWHPEARYSDSRCLFDLFARMIDGKQDI
ncbi:MAG: gamma-glutamyl-gamma-aminobutyrate hydrolase family protein [Candidatus Ornithospirochaeta sp.]|nr:gamma-glutamyl-gamma-aminobutyrate hydrolase family protein [Candidatus Ornithospirochaeta sp.]